MALSPTTDINTNPLAAAQFSTLYGPNTQQALRRSQYLADAIRQNAEGSQNIHGGAELGVRLLAQAILQHGNNAGQDQLIKAMAADQGDESARMLAALNPPSAAPDAAMGAAPIQLPAAQQPAPQVSAPQPPAAPQIDTVPPVQAGQYSPQDRDALTRMLATEAIGEGPQGMAAAGHVALNRLRDGYGGARSLADVVYQPHQFTGMSRANQVNPQDYAAAGQVADGLLSGQIPDPTNGAKAFLNPELTVQQGYHIPKWAQGGDGVRIGRHVFFGGGRQAQNAVPGPPPPPDPNGPPVQDVQPYQVAANGPTPPPPSAPGLSPPAAGAAPAAVPPQAPSAGAQPAQQQAWPKWKPSSDEVAYVTKLLNSPKDHAAGVALAQHYQQKMLEPEEAQITLINGVPFYIPKDPTSAAHTQPIPVPAAAMTQIRTAEQLGVAAPRGTTFSVDPTGNPKPLSQPSTGQQVVSGPGQPYQEHYIPGGANDPTRTQAPAQGYQYGPQGQGAIQGGPADPRAPMNLAAGTQKIQQDVRPLLDLAVVAKQSVGAVQEGYKQQNGTGDIAMVNGLQHLIDKGVVRGEDVNMQMKSNGIAGGLGQISQYINSNGLLTPDVREKVLRAANALYGNIDQQYRAQVMSHRPTVDAIYGQGAFDKYVVPAEQQTALGWADAKGVGTPPPPPTPQQQPQLAPGTRDAALAEARRRGLLH